MSQTVLRRILREKNTIFPRIVSTSAYFPETVWTNEDLCKLYSPRRPDYTLVQPEWIERKLGIRQRRLALTKDGHVIENSVDMAVRVGKEALKNAKVDSKELGCVVYVTPTPKSGEFQQDMQEISQRLKLSEDCNLVHHHIGCPALPTAFKTVWGELLRDKNRPVLLVDSTSVSATMNNPTNARIKYMEGLSTSVKPHPWAWLTPFLFADGAAGAVFKASRSRGIFDIGGYHNPNLQIMIQRGGTCNQFLGGDDLAKDAYITVPETVAEHYVPTLLRMDDISTMSHKMILNRGRLEGRCIEPEYDMCLVHQANFNLVNKLIDELKKRDHYKNCIFPVHVDEVGNVSSPCTIALRHDEVQKGNLKKGDVVKYVVVGAGNGGGYGYILERV